MVRESFDESFDAALAQPRRTIPPLSLVRPRSPQEYGRYVTPRSVPRQSTTSTTATSSCISKVAPTCRARSRCRAVSESFRQEPDASNRPWLLTLVVSVGSRR